MPVGIIVGIRQRDDTNMTLTDNACKNAKPSDAARKMSDGGGLYLFVTPSGSKLWRMNYRFEGKQKTLSFGAYPAVGLKDARAHRDKAKSVLASGRDPAVQTATEDSFEAVAREWHRSNETKWVPQHSARVLSRLVQDVFPEIGGTRVSEITPSHVLAVLRKVEGRGVRDTPRRLRQSISSVFRYAVASGLTQLDPAASIHDALKARPKTKHRAALKPEELPEFFARLAKYAGNPVTAKAIYFTMLTMTRTAEVRFATWAEFQGDTWRIPAERMKMGKEHLVPLSPQAQAVLATLDRSTEWVFPGVRGSMSENTMIYALYRMGYHSRVTVHGMRSLASTMMNESGLWRADAIERQLAHTPKNEVRAAYNAALYWPERCKMMSWWGDWIEQQKMLGEMLG